MFVVCCGKCVKGQTEKRLTLYFPNLQQFVMYYTLCLTFLKCNAVCYLITQ